MRLVSLVAGSSGAARMLFSSLSRILRGIRCVVAGCHPMLNNRRCLANRRIYRGLYVDGQALRSCESAKLLKCIRLPKGVVCQRDSVVGLLSGCCEGSGLGC